MTPQKTNRLHFREIMQNDDPELGIGNPQYFRYNEAVGSFPVLSGV